MKRICSMLLALAMVLGPIPVQVNANTLDNGLEYEVYDDHVEITYYTGDAAVIVVPAEIEGLPVTGIDRGAFSYTNLESITLPATVTSIEWESLAYCNKLKGIYVDENNPVYSNDALGILFNKDKTEIVQVPGAMEGIYQIPDEVERIMPYSFAGCENLTKVIVPAGVKCLDYHSFSRCSSLTEIVIPDRVTRIEDRCFSGCSSLTTISIPNSVTYLGERAFSGCSSLTSIVLPDRLTEIGGETFYNCDSLSSVTISDSVTRIGGMAFYECDSLERIVIPQNVTFISKDAFSDCRALSSVSFMGDAPQIPWEIFYGVTATAYYPAGNETWTEDVMNTCGGTITWLPISAHTHEYSAVVTQPTCTMQGYTTYTCSCGNICVGDYVPALGHETVDKVCIRCGQTFRTPFSDVPSSAFYEEPVIWALENGITNGTSDTAFSPEDPCQRAHVVTFLHRAAKNPEPTVTDCLFTDVPEGSFFRKPVLWAVEKGITNGISATEFGSYAICNRAAVVTFLWRAAGKPEPAIQDNPFTDVTESDYFYQAVLWAVENGITMGVDATHFGPATNCNRAQVVTFLYRAYN